MRENDDIDQNLQAVSRDIGYVRSKWVMEKIADLAAAQGLPLMTFRPATPPATAAPASTPIINGGAAGENLHQQRHGAGSADLREGLTTVDYMTQAIAHVSRNPQALRHKFNLIHQATIT